MTALGLFERLTKLSTEVDLGQLQIVIRLEDADQETHMGGVATVSIESGCTDTPALVFDCDQDPANCPLEEDE